MLSLTVVIMVIQQAPTFLPTEILESKGFTLLSFSQYKNQGSREEWLLSAQSPDPYRSLDIRLARHDSARTGVLIDLRQFATSQGHQATLPTQIPAGFEQRWIKNLKSGSDSMRASSKFEDVDFRLKLQRTADPSGVWWKTPEHDWASDEKFLEKLVRHTLARAAGERLDTPRSRTFGAQAMLSAVCQRSQRMFIHLDDWARAKGWSIEWNAEPDYATLRKGTHYAILPLSSGKVKVDGVWRVMPDIVAMKNGKWFVSEEGIGFLAGL